MLLSYTGYGKVLDNHSHKNGWRYEAKSGPTNGKQEAALFKATTEVSQIGSRCPDPRQNLLLFL
jgi:hypothetical protein